MFDWEDQELAIIWGEADDHIVPYPEESERKSQSVFVYHDNNEAHEEPANSKLSEQNPAATKTNLHGCKPESNDDLSFAASDPELNCIGKGIDLEKGPEISEDHNEDRELNDIISNSWANIGSFDDLDCIFSNDAVVDHANLDSTDDLWALSRDAVKSSSLALDSTSWVLEPTGNSWSRTENVSHQSTCLPYQHISKPYFPEFSYGNLSDQCTSTSVLPGIDDEYQAILPNAEVCLSERVCIDKSIDTPMKSQNMTPQEKIEKLRRRQRMRALLAIKKQQQQLSHPVQISDHSIAQKSSEEDQVLHLAKADFKAEENMDTIYDPSSPLIQDGSSAVSMDVVDHNVEETVLNQLQDVVTKLDTKIRFCIRDSLFRLAQSAMQRNDASDSSRANKNGGCEPNILKENMSNQESFMKTPSAETETNCIDRVVAHLLFHQSTSKNLPRLESTVSSSTTLSFVTKSSEDLSKQPQTDTSMNQKRKQMMVETAD